MLSRSSVCVWGGRGWGGVCVSLAGLSCSSTNGTDRFSREQYQLPPNPTYLSVAEQVVHMLQLHLASAWLEVRTRWQQQQEEEGAGRLILGILGQPASPSLSPRLTSLNLTTEPRW